MALLTLTIQVKSGFFFPYHFLGTPGVGKSTLCSELMKQTGFEWLEVGKIAKDHECYEGYDNVYECPILDEDKVSMAICNI